ncbi:MAG: hypothetical protein AAGF45_04320 [Pseudomonadota bacterium]
MISDLAPVLAKTDALVFAAIASVVALAALNRKGRPVTRSRTFDVGLSALLFVALGVRFAILAFLALSVPSAVLPGATPTAVSAFASICGVCAVLGFVSHRGSLGLRVAGACAFALASVIEVTFRAAYAPTTVITVVDAIASIALAAATGLIAAYFWIYRTATPSPLGRDKRPFDY